MSIERRPLREQIKDEVIRRLHRDEIEIGTSINEMALAAELGVSRTPMREALIALQYEGIIQSERGKGFRFAPLSPTEFAELAPILAALEALALESTDPAYLSSIAKELLDKAHQFTAASAPHAVIEHYDDEWHDLLLSGCPNERLMDLITTLKVSMRRYARVMISDTDILERAAEEHSQIAQRLIEEDLPGAVAALKQNWRSGTARVLERLGPE